MVDNTTNYIKDINAYVYNKFLMLFSKAKQNLLFRDIMSECRHLFQLSSSKSTQSSLRVIVEAIQISHLS